MPEKRYTILLSEADRMIVRQDRDGFAILAFSVQLEILVKGHWRKAIRFDSSHGRPHRHIFYPSGKEYKEFMPNQENNEAFTQAQTILKATFEAIHQRYISILERKE